jgi:hypothetical protein
MKAGQMAKDTQELLADLHAGLAQHLKERLEEGIITTGELNILRQFLKDNAISAQPVEGSPFGDLVASVPDIDKVIPMRKIS